MNSEIYNKYSTKLDPVVFLTVICLLTVLIPHYMNSFLKWVAYSSFCIFLFHRPVWTILLWVWNERTFFQSLFVFFIGIPIIFILSYITQTFYNQVVVNTLSKLQS